MGHTIQQHGASVTVTKLTSPRVCFISTQARRTLRCSKPERQTFTYQNVETECRILAGWAVSGFYGYLKGVNNEMAEKYLPNIPPRNDSLAGPQGRRSDQVKIPPPSLNPEPHTKGCPCTNLPCDLQSSVSCINHSICSHAAGCAIASSKDVPHATLYPPPTHTRLLNFPM